ncbi:hypothetical protein TorRG33x02_164740 [Trema orientale]|uniref:Uncharacterized protein n=1 Tax=Trema orientale TaxID=63057 RepID=A0A2P5EQI8_TREOI|nr:hypothetical protein TorRG33x02_164740 [Trema orientale]
MSISFNRRESTHMAIKLNRWPGILALSIASNHGVECEYVWVIDLGKDVVGIPHWSRESNNGKDQVFAHIWVCDWDAMSDRKGVDLHQFGLRRSAELQQRYAFRDRNVWSW